MQAQLKCRFLVSALACSLLLTSGCKKNKPPVPPPQAQAPTVTAPPQQQPTTPESTTPPATQPSTEATNTQPANTTAAEKAPSKPKKSGSVLHRHPTTSAQKKPAPPPPSPTTTAKASPPPSEEAVTQISPDMSGRTLSQTQQSTTQLLDSTEKMLRSITRTLNNDEQNTVAQIRSYVTQARSALKDQDLERAHNLALKAHQLSDVLVKQ